jgi:hypothetical protein
MADIERASAKAQSAQMDLGSSDIPIDALTKMALLSDRIGTSMEDMIRLWKSNTTGAKEFQNAIDKLSGGTSTGDLGDFARGKASLMEQVGGFLTGASWPDWALDLTPAGFAVKALRRRGAGLNAQDEVLRQMIKLGTSPVLGPGNAAGMKELLGIRGRASVNSFSLTSPNAGGLAAIGGFTAGAGILAQTAAKTQADLLKIIAENTRIMADIARAEQTEGTKL